MTVLLRGWKGSNCLPMDHLQMHTLLKFTFFLLLCAVFQCNLICLCIKTPYLPELVIILSPFQIIYNNFPGKMSNTECYITCENIDYSDTTGMVILLLLLFVQFFPYSFCFLYTIEDIKNTYLHFCQCYWALPHSVYCCWAYSPEHSVVRSYPSITNSSS